MRSQRSWFPILTLFTVAALMPCATYAQEATSKVEIEQQSAIEAVGKWTLLKPDEKTIVITAKEYAATGLPAGIYTLFVTPPAGTSVAIDRYAETALVQTINSPQHTFELGDGDSIRFVLRYSATKLGLVSVDSIPTGIPFTMKGPNEMEVSGVTPASYPGSPVGQYTVYYEPKGCVSPKPISQQLIRDSRIQFMFEPDCKTLEVERSTKRRELIGPILFLDVPETAWYAPYVYRITRLSILTGYRDENGNLTGRFGPSSPVTLAELAKIAHEVAGIDENLVQGIPDNPMARTGSAAFVGPWFQQYILSAEQLGFRIYQDPTLDIGRPANRAEVLVTLLQALDIPLQWSKGTMFTDVTRRTPYASAVETASADGIVSGRTGSDGKPTGIFDPFAPITRAELTKILGAVIDRYRSSLEEGSE